MSLEKNGIIVNGGKDRPSEPTHWHKTNTKSSKWHWKQNPAPVPANHELPMTFHHVIGWQRIWQMWNHLVVKDRWDVIREWAHLMQIDGAAVDAMQKGTLDDVDPVVEKICWSPWNMVEGPRGSYREDDPSKDNKDIDYFQFGGSHTARTRMSDLLALFNAMTVALRAVPNADPAFDQLRKMLHDLRHLRNKEMIRFEESMWEVVKPGKYDKFGNAERHTTWRKATK